MDDTLAYLSEDELTAVVGLVDAVVRRDRRVLELADAYEGDAQPFLWVDSYYGSSGASLVLPPGKPAAWRGNVVRRTNDPRTAAVWIEMYDRREGLTDLTLEVDLSSTGDGRAKATFRDLHVL